MNRVGDRSYIVRIGNRDVKRYDDLIRDNFVAREIPARRTTYGCTEMVIQKVS